MTLRPGARCDALKLNLGIRLVPVSESVSDLSFMPLQTRWSWVHADEDESLGLRIVCLANKREKRWSEEEDSNSSEDTWLQEAVKRDGITFVFRSEVFPEVITLLTRVTRL